MKPCPFCGRKAIVCAPLEDITGFVIRCDRWGCCEKSSERTETNKSDLNKLITAWNTRHIEKQCGVCGQGEEVDHNGCIIMGMHR